MKNDISILSRRTVVLLFVIMIIIQILFLIIHGVHKSGFHVDEIWSYGLSNSFDEAFFYSGKYGSDRIDEQFNHWMDGTRFHEYITVQNDERFSFYKVYYNQSQDVHPPIYYYLLHAVCSLYPNTLNKWTGIIPNIIIFVLCQMLLFILGSFILKSKELALYSCLLWGFGMGAINTFIFIRMYSLLVLLVLLTTLLHYYLMKTKRISVYLNVAIIIITYLGGLTQYYFIPYTLFISIIYISVALYQRKYKCVLFYVISMMFAAVCIYISFPPILNHLNGSIRGDEAINGLIGISPSPILLISFMNLLFQEVIGLPSPFSDMMAIISSASIGFVVKFIYIVVIITGISFIIFIYKRKRDTLKNVLIQFKNRLMQFFAVVGINSILIKKIKYNEKLIFIFFATIPYIWLISNISPDMGIYQDRYVFCIFPMVSILYIKSVALVLSKMRNERLKFIVILLVCVASVIGSHVSSHKEYLFLDTENRVAIRETVKDADCIYVTHSDYLLHSMSDAFMNSNRIFPTRPNDLDSIKIAISSMKGLNKNILVISDECLPFEQFRILSYIEDNTQFTTKFIISGVHGNIKYNMFEVIFE